MCCPRTYRAICNAHVLQVIDLIVPLSAPCSPTMLKTPSNSNRVFHPSTPAGRRLPAWQPLPPPRRAPPVPPATTTWMAARPLPWTRPPRCSWATRARSPAARVAAAAAAAATAAAPERPAGARPTVGASGTPGSTGSFSSSSRSCFSASTWSTGPPTPSGRRRMDWPSES